jgi:hypothetical protein
LPTYLFVGAHARSTTVSDTRTFFDARGCS